MTSGKNKRFGPAAAKTLLAGLLALSILWACNVNGEKGHTYFEIQADSAWADYEYLRITWTDPATGKTRDLFYGTPAEFGSSRKLADDTYQGQKIEITIAGILDNKTVMTEVLVYLGSENRIDSIKSLLLPGIALSYDDKSLAMGDKDTFNLPIVKVSPEALFDKSLLWTSSNDNVFIVAGNSLIARGAGTATLIGALRADAAKFAAFSVTVTAYNVPVEKVAFQADSLTIFAGVASTELVVDVTPIQANPGFEIFLSDTTFAKIESGRILGLAEGKLKVYVKSKGNPAARDTLPVTVLPNPNTGKPIPGAPVIASLEALDGKISLVWIPVTGADTYTLYYQEGSTVEKASGTPIKSAASPATISGLKNGTQYAFALAAANTTGESVLGPVRVAAPAPFITAKPKQPTVTLTKKSAVLSFNDFLAFSATAHVEGALLKNYVWDYNGDGLTDAQGPLSGATAEITGGYRYLAVGPYKAILKVFTDGDSSAQAEVDIQVLQDRPKAYAGLDLTVYTAEVVRLEGKAEDSLGRIDKAEWKIGGAEFRSARPDTAFTAPAAAGDIECILRATDDDGQAVQDTMVVHVISRAQALLTGITPSFGTLSPQFDPAAIAYTDTVPYDTTAIRFAVSGNGTIKVNAIEVASGATSASIPLDTGRNTIGISVELPDVPAKTYTVIVFRTPASDDANLSGLTPSSGLLVPGLNAVDSVYRDSVPTAVTEIRLTPVSSDPKAKVMVNGAILARGETSAAIPLKIGPNAVSIVVTAQSGRKKTYAINIIRGFSDEGRLSAMVLTATGPKGSAVMTLEAPFSSGTYEYFCIPTDGQISVKIQATAMDTGATLTVNGIGVASGSLSGAIELATDSASILKIQVTAQDRKAVVTYTIKLPRSIDVGYASDQLGERIYKTLDRGKTWKKITNLPNAGSTQPAMSAFFPEANTGYLVGPEGSINKTSDGGKTWTKQVSGTDLYLWDVHFTSRDVGYVAGGLPGNGTEAAQGVILKTIDGGANWSRQLIPYTSFSSVQFVNANVGYAGGYGADTSIVHFGSVYKTVNAGATWTPVARPHDCKKLAFVDANTGLSVGNDGASRTTDGGLTWTKLTVSPTGYISGIQFVNATTGYMYGYEGIKKTVDAGLTWVDKLPGDDFFGVGFWDANTGLAAGGGRGTVMHTADGGSNWTAHAISPTGTFEWVFCIKR